MPKLSVDPGDPGYETVRLDRAKDFPGIGIDLMGIFRSRYCPTHSVPSSPTQVRSRDRRRARDRGKHTSGFRIDLLDAILSDLKQVFPIECCPGMRRDIDRAYSFAGRRIEGMQLVPGRKPDTLAVISDSMHLVSPWKGTIFTDYFGCGALHTSTLIDRQGTRE